MERLSARIHGEEYVPEYAQIDVLREAVRELHKDVKKLKSMELGEELRQLLRDQAARMEQADGRRETSTSEEEKQEDSAAGQGEIIENDDTMEPPAKSAGRRHRNPCTRFQWVPVSESKQLDLMYRGSRNIQKIKKNTSMAAW